MKTEGSLGKCIYLLTNEVKNLLQQKSDSFISPSLLLSKYADPRLKGDDRKDLLKKVIKQVELTQDSIKLRCEDQLDFLLDLWPKDTELKDYILFGRLQSRLVVNMSGGVLENANLCLDQYGVPYIPGSAVKGCARRAAIAALNMWKDKEAPKESPWPELYEGFREKKQMIRESLLVFGWVSKDWEEDSDWEYASGGKAAWKEISSDLAKDFMLHLKPFYQEEEEELGIANFAGMVQFLPAYPMLLSGGDKSLPIQLELDVISCHHMKYYGENKEIATDDENPNPVFFITVGPDAIFSFPLIGRRNNKEYVNLAKRFLSVGLRVFGIGAKTSSGYGWFDLRSTQQAESYVKSQKEKREKEALRASLKPDLTILEELKGLKQDQLRQKINWFSEEEKYWDKRYTRDEIYQYTLIYYLLRENTSLYESVKNSPTNKSYRGIQNLAKKFSFLLP
ncbi:type III-B CRISPR module RAMP protein Cmr6 [Methylacidiphilum caldifontis]|uniref:Type III-B CRISPR module RAMP protein Cmr6 n=1 Tax=Methylacidiphilum caldifontis TaxID=2795386 RepID=A0A4Y8P980_9BACT|nr:type III-B CRISPR module RAMP protein Cmr6 [Methylacidiphilum caldifontis]TFE65723.1 type III-B CRISPR module RAMP protein Cmr6 [Methylacidiphilum caldifontis]